MLVKHRLSASPVAAPKRQPGQPRWGDSSPFWKYVCHTWRTTSPYRAIV